jgi:multiple sugar transport system substrate-binding protein
MRNVKKVLALFLVAAIPLVMLGGCSSSAKTNQSNSSKGVVNISFWDMDWGNDQYPTVGQSIVDKFNKTHSNIKVSYQALPWTNYYQTFAEAIASNTTPDCSSGSGYQSVQFYAAGHISSLDDLVQEMQKSGEIKDFAPGTLEYMKYNGHYFALPWQIDLRVIFYNKDLLKAAGVNPPTNWDEFEAACKKVTNAAKGTYGFIIPNDQYGRQVCISFFQNNNGGLFTADKKANVTDPKNLEALTYLTNLSKEGVLDPAGAGMTDNDARNEFQSGKVAFIMDTANYGMNLANTKNSVGILDPLKSPSGTVGTHRSVNNYMVYSASKHTTEAKEFLRWWTENNIELWSEGGANGIPVRKSLQENSYFTNLAMYKTVIDKWLPAGKVLATHYTTWFPQLNQIDGDQIMEDMAVGVTLKKDPSISLQAVQNVLLKYMAGSGS